MTKLARLNLEIDPQTKEEIRTEALRRGESMTQTIVRAWLLYQRLSAGDLYTVVKKTESEGEFIKLEVL